MTRCRAVTRARRADRIGALVLAPLEASLPTPLTPLIGREREVEFSVAALRRPDARLVTLSGPGGVGKTRLAIRVATDLAGDFADGVRFVALAAVLDPVLVPSTIAHALDVAEWNESTLLAALIAALRDREMLLVLDNFEQVIPAAEAVAALLSAAPGLKVLVTSRSLLRLSGERNVPVPPLALPSLDGSTPAADVAGAESVQLFVARAQAAQPAFALTETTASAAAAICHRLDGLPLAIELAAARINVLPPTAMLARLSRPLPLLVRGARDLPIRQQTLRGAVAWSYDLLEPDEQALLRRLAVFVGGFSLDLVEPVVALDSAIDAIDGLASLVDKSLLQPAPAPLEAGGPGFAMLETIRAFGLEELAAAGEEEDVRHRHASAMAAMAEQLAPRLERPAPERALDRLEANHDNLRAALTWALDGGDRRLGQRLAADLGLFWYLRGHVAEGRRWLDAALAAGGEPLDPWDARARRAAGRMVREQGDYDRATALLTEALRLYRRLGDAAGAAGALDDLGIVALYRCDHERASTLHEESLALFEALEDAHGVNEALGNLGLIALEHGDGERARELFARGLEGRRAVGDRRGEAVALQNLGWAALHQGNPVEAVDISRQSLELYRAVADRRNIPQVLHTIGAGEFDRRRVEAARAAFAEGLVLAQEIGDQRLLAYYLEELALVAAALGHH
ncbi:MAG: tetratricopeptide repeat protein, partial [Chloroflexota bacterium]|nr:tetratricopeptide repeat protein [Chloroflexota bacterium]